MGSHHHKKTPVSQHLQVLIALEKLQTNTYDIILMDLQMPEMNGFEQQNTYAKQ
jgi:CheY-like chemotaxis protein